MKKETISKNYLENVPFKAVAKYTTDENGIVTLEIENTGLANKIAQIFFKRPKVSFIHLDEYGSFVWNLTNGENDLIAIGKEVENRFGEDANPLYERLAKFFKILENYKFITFK